MKIKLNSHKFKFVFLLVMLICLFGQNPKKVDASTATIATNNTWVNGSISNDVMYYHFSIPSAGKVTYTLQSYSDDAKCLLYDGDIVKNHGYVSCGGTENAPETRTLVRNLEAGHYALKVCNYWGDDEWTGNFRIRISFEAAKNNEKEPNNLFDSAMYLNENQQVKGFISDDDAIDFYKIKLNTAKTVKFYYNFSNGFVFSIWNADLVEEREDAWYHDLNGSGEMEIYLNAGTHYLKVRRDSDSGNEGNTGVYSLKYRTYQYISGVVLKKSTLVLDKGKTYGLLKTITPSNASNKVLKWTSDNKSIATVSSKGIVNAKSAGTTTIRVETTDGSKTEASCQIIVKPGKMVISKCSRETRCQIKVRVKSQKNLSGIQYQLSKMYNFKKKSTYNAGSTETVATTAKLTPKKKYYFRVRGYIYANGKTYYGPWSSIKSISTLKNQAEKGYCLWKNV